VAGEAVDSAGAAGTGGATFPVFRGVTQLALDAKGRLAVPAKHRDALAINGQGRLVLTADPSRCLLLYPLAAWEPIQARLMSLSSFNDKIRSLQRLLVGYADDVDIDTAGRILVPPALRRYANLDKHVVLVGQGHKFELWDEAQWQAQTAQAIAFPADGLPSELDGFTL
jgi:MraZ protein